MRVSCPNCAATYEVPDHLIGAAGRKLRCARCGAGWTVHRPDPGMPPVPDQAGPLARGLGGIAPGPGPAGPDPMGHAPAMPAPAAAPPLDRDARAGPMEAPPHAPPPGPTQHRPPQLIEPPLPQPEEAAEGEGFGLILAWAITVIAVVAGVTLLYLFREEVMEAWPPSVRLFSVLGVGPPGR